MLVLQTYHFDLANKKRFLRSAFCYCFLMAVNSTDGESGMLRSRQYTYYILSDIEAVLDPVEVAKLVAWQGGLLTDIQLRRDSWAPPN